MKNFLFFPVLSFIALQAYGVELELASERIRPGIVLVFEGAVKDIITPSALHLEEKQTHVHIEARVNWDEKNIPEGAVPGGFIPYLHITAQVINEKTGISSFVDLTPHVNLIDNFHYARNISLPGGVSDRYKVIFTLSPPSLYELAVHKDWSDKHGDTLFKDKTFTYKHVSFKAIAQASRR